MLYNMTLFHRPDHGRCVCSALLLVLSVRPVTGSFKARAGQQQRVRGVGTHQTVVRITVT